jgi:UDP-N-acetyl-2-amino-2-deoxyglucuronate dehydrogenase
MESTNFALIGVGGYIAPRHMGAIRSAGGTLRAAVDPKDSVGIIDRHFPDAHFFIDFEPFAEHVAGLAGTAAAIDYVSVCSPNHLHKAHVSWVLRVGADAICEKPLVLDPGDIDELATLERSTGRRINAILQLRLHPSIVDLKRRIAADRSGRIWDIDLTYVTARGRWYHVSWKGDDMKSGGIATNIGVHFYDMLSFVFGSPLTSHVHYRARNCAAGYLQYERARVRWLLSIDRRHMTTAEGFAQRCMMIHDLGHYDFSRGFEDLHTASYREILAGRGFGLADARPSIETVARIRAAPIEPGKGSQHPLLTEVLAGSGGYGDGLAA